MSQSRLKRGLEGLSSRISAAGVCLLIATTAGPTLAGPITPGATIVQVHAASRFFEGPSWDPLTARLYFSSLTGDGELFRLSPPTTVDLWLDDTQGINGTFLANDGRLLCAQGNTRRIVSMRIGADGPEDPVVLAHDPAWNAPNDLCQVPNGDIYFTTPDFATGTTSRVYRLNLGGAATPVIADMPLCNGLISSLSGDTLYVSDSQMKWWRSYPVNADGSVGAGSVFFDPSTSNQNDPDGMTIDELGNLYFAGRGGFWIVSPDGQQLDMVAVPEFVTNLTFGGVEGRTLYITCDGKLYSLAMEVRGGRWYNVPEENQPPAVAAGSDLVTSSQTYTAVLHGTADDDGLPNPPGVLVVMWSKLAGPGSVVFSAPTSIDTAATFSAVGTYTLQLLAYDGIRSATDHLTVVVQRTGDLDNDTDVDQTDIALFHDCLTGPDAGPRASGCEMADFDTDQDVDQADFGILQRCMSGGGTTSDPDCAG